MRRLIAGLLLLLFAYHLMGVYPLGMWQRQQFRAAAAQRRAHRPDFGLTRITVACSEAAQAQLRWITDDEFRFRGSLYDALYTHVGTDSVTYWCWHDQGEEQLLDRVAAHPRDWAHPSAEAGKMAKKLFGFWLAVLMPDPGVALPKPLLESTRPHYAAFLQGHGTRPPAAPFVPPRAVRG
ncbi:hypothetical protein F0P96_12125 [Hymenobacter busanensis]|uniref:Uncharacterized protein n=1 Tax=Hymenobacter busanensis TaxID=2607656 RepID=A0A7L4ZVE4_9BACT|nr:hypothetical protein [Hymenobacter busanensis]KAA9332223.1 hypothetical protein F0P96_12125 [Hymenobacter busanensis]QHJ07439.1 hypothetical protein GUY19_09145 [Hymenobacter busanensis]